MTRCGKSVGNSCVFHGTFIREQVDPKVQALYKEVRNQAAPFSKMRLAWKEVHCPLINPYGSDHCPYAEAECAMAFLVAAQRSVDKRNPAAYFRALARSYGIDRADNKPLARDRIRTDGTQGPRHPGAARPGDGSGLGDDGALLSGAGLGSGHDHPIPSTQAHLRRPNPGPQRMGELLRSLDLGPHQRPATDGKESPK